MGYSEAIADGIRIARPKSGTQYFPLCQVCGKEVCTIAYQHDKRYLCAGCRKDMKKLEASGICWESLFPKWKR